MKKLIMFLVVNTLSFAALAEVYVPYGQWTDLPHCGGETRLTCPDVDNARQLDLCKIEFRNSYNCPKINLYVSDRFQPKGATKFEDMDQSFNVYDSHVNFSGTFRTFMHNSDNSIFEQVTYKFNY